MDGVGHADLLRRAAGIHAFGAIGSKRHGVMRIAPVKMVIGKQVRAHAQRFHALQLRPVGHLAVLQREAVIGRRMLADRLLDAVDGQVDRGVTVGVGVHLDAVAHRQPVDLLQIFGLDVPHALGRAVVIARPAQPGRKSLDRSVCMGLDPPHAQGVGRARFQADRPLDGLLDGLAAHMHGRHQPHREVVRTGDLQQAVDG